MSKFCKIDCRQFKNLQKNLEKLEKTNKICENTAKELGQALYKKTVNKTPVKTGNLKRNWQVKGEPLTNGYETDVYNQVEYAAYNEFGHRKKDNKGWVPGKFMLTTSETEVKRDLEKVVDKNIQKELGELFNDKQNN